MSGNRVYLYDSTLRDGAQTQGVDFTAADKVAIASELDRLGIDYIEGGWPGANATDDQFFAAPPTLRHARLAAFGMTRRIGRSADNDPGFQALLTTQARVVTLVGKAWAHQVKVALSADTGENLKMVGDSVKAALKRVDEVLFDAEHFFDGFKEDPDYAVACLEEAYQAGARWMVLCDTNGGTLPHEIGEIVTAVTQRIPGDHLGIHCHNDTENAVANSLTAVLAGVRQVQGTLNGLGERCGNANLVSLIPTLLLKMGMETGVTEAGLRHLKTSSHMLDERLNRAPNRHAPYVGGSAFAHKGGLHASAVAKDPACYEHVDPETVGNMRRVVISDQSGRSNILARLAEAGIAVDPDDPRINTLLAEVKDKEADGLTFDGADASFELFARRYLGGVPEFFQVHSFRVIDERRYNAKGELIHVSEATARILVNDVYSMEAGEGHGPVNALDAALRKVLVPAFPELMRLALVDYKVRIMAPERGTAAVTRVMIESTNTATGARWTTVGISEDIIDASFNALHDSIVYFLMGAAAH
ncbi:MAG: citramalate synthase [Rhodospirillaceae bacterium]|nr:citramalate synthase [Rhodospirillaceae bacterium]